VTAAPDGNPGVAWYPAGVNRASASPNASLPFVRYRTVYCILIWSIETGIEIYSNQQAQASGTNREPGGGTYLNTRAKQIFEVHTFTVSDSARCPWSCVSRPIDGCSVTTSRSVSRLCRGSHNAAHVYSREIRRNSGHVRVRAAIAGSLDCATVIKHNEFDFSRKTETSFSVVLWRPK
jgi:hypothetical protein